MTRILDIPDALGRAVFRSAPDPIVVTDEQGRIRYVNQRTVEVFRYEARDLVGQQVEILVPEALREGHASIRSQYEAAPRPRQMGIDTQLFARRKDGTEFPVEISMSPVEYEDGLHVVAIIRDVRRQRKIERELRYASTHDALTKLYNRHFFEAELDRIERGRRYPVAILVFDIDGLKRVNDLHGHEEGDRVIAGTADLLRSLLRADDILARLGGDEFAAILPETSREHLEARIQQIRARIGEQSLSHKEVNVHFCVGGAICAAGEALRDTLAAADRRMYEEKETRRTLDRTAAERASDPDGHGKRGDGGL